MMMAMTTTAMRSCVWVLVFVVLACAAPASSKQGSVEPKLGDLVQQATQAERSGNSQQAVSLYYRVLLLKPHDPEISVKIAQLTLDLGHPEQAGKFLLDALDALNRNAKASAETKKMLCSALMGRFPASRSQLRGGEPFRGLPKQDQIRIVKTVPRDWLFTSKGDEAYHAVNLGEFDRAVKMITELAAEGDWKYAAAFVSNPVDFKQREYVVRGWQREAEKGGNPSLWMAMLHGCYEARMTSLFQAAFPKALPALKDQPAILMSLRADCRELNWQEGLNQLKPLVPESDQTFRDAIAELRKDVDSASLEATKARLLRISADYPDEDQGVLDGKIVRKMLANGWYDLLVKLLPAPALHDRRQGNSWSIYNTGPMFEVHVALLEDSAQHHERLDLWMRKIIEADGNDAAGSALLSAAANLQKNSLSDAIWLDEQALRMFPKDPGVLCEMAQLYEFAKRPDDAFPLFKQAVLYNEESNLNGLSCVNRIFRFGEKEKRVSDVAAWLWDNREKLPLYEYAHIAEDLDRDNEPADALKWMEEGLRLEKTAAEPDAILEGISAWATHIELLRKLGRTDEADRLLAEARKRFQNQDIDSWLGQKPKPAEIDWPKRYDSAKEELRRLAEPGASEPPCGTLLDLAQAIVKTGKEKEVDSIAKDLMPLSKSWQEGLKLAVALFRDRIGGILPFAKWSVSATGPNDNIPLPHPLRDFSSHMGDLSLAGAYSVAAQVTAPEDVRLYHIGWNHEDRFYSDFGLWQMTDEDRSTLAKALSGQKLNISALANWLEIGPQNRAPNNTDKFVAEMVARCPGLAIGILWTIDRSISAISSDELKKRLDERDKATNWDFVTSEQLSLLARKLREAGMGLEADRLQGVHTGRADGKSKIDEHSAPGTASKSNPSTDETSARAWLQRSTDFTRLKKPDEAKKSAEKALELAKSPAELLQAISRIMVVSPNEGVSIALHRLPDMLSKPADPMISQGMLFIVSRVVYAVDDNHSLAKRAAPLVDRVFERFGTSGPRPTVSPGERAMMHFWSGDDAAGLAILREKPGGGWFMANARWLSACPIIIRSDVSDKVRAKARRILEEQLSSAPVNVLFAAAGIAAMPRISLGYSMQPIQPMQLRETPKRNYTFSNDGLGVLADLLADRISKVEVSGDPRVLTSIVWSLSEIGSAREVKPGTAQKWLDLFKVIVDGAAKNPETRSSVVSSPRKWQADKEKTDFAKTEMFKQIVEKIDSVERTK